VTRSRAALVCAALAAGCAAPPPVHDWSTYSGPGAEHFQRAEVELPTSDDPYESFNRVIFDMNKGVLIEVLEPLAELYRALVPRGVRRGLDHAFDNLRYPERVLSNLLQGQGGGAWDETKRFALNSTVGLLGFRDVAVKHGLPDSDEDFGRVFRAWGWDNADYLVVPAIGSYTTRDFLGWGFGLGVDITAYHWPAGPAREFNRITDDLPALAEALRVYFDPYELARLLYVLEREAVAEPAPLAGERDGATETLGTLFLTPRDRDFLKRSRTFEVVHPKTGRLVPYSLWLQPGATPVDYIIPGLGGHRTSDAAVALAEAVYEAGISAVTISSSLNHEFIALASSEELPGILPSDAHDTHVLLDAIDKDLRARFPGRVTGRRVGGISFGGITTLYIAASTDPDLITFDVYLAVNAPLSLEYGARKLDELYNAPLSLPEDARRPWMDALFRKALRLVDQGIPAGQGDLPFTSLEAKFLIGLVFRATLREVILQTQLQNDHGVLHAPLDPVHRRHAYREIDQFSLTEYVYAFVLPYLARERSDVTLDEAGASELFRRCDVRSIAPALKANPRLRFATNRNDFLLAPGDLEWITELLGPDRVTVFERGGHLGNLYRDDIQAVLAAEIAEAAGEAESSGDGEQDD
jgi:ABC-type transporter lipoprotein component MlaA